MLHGSGSFIFVHMGHKQTNKESYWLVVSDCFMIILMVRAKLNFVPLR